MVLVLICILFDWISPKVVSFLILGTFEDKIIKEAFSGVFGVKSAENDKVSKVQAVNSG